MDRPMDKIHHTDQHERILASRSHARNRDRSGDLGLVELLPAEVGPRNLKQEQNPRVHAAALGSNSGGVASRSSDPLQPAHVRHVTESQASGDHRWVWESWATREPLFITDQQCTSNGVGGHRQHWDE